MGDVSLLEGRQVEHGRGRVDATGDGTDKIIQRNAGAYERERRRVYAGLEEAAVLLENVNEDVDL